MSNTTTRAEALAELIAAIDALLPHLGGHDCCCMGPKNGHNLCPCEEKGLTRKYLSDWRCQLRALAQQEGAKG